MSDIYIRLDQLNEVKSNLGNIVDEFESAVSNSEALEGAIARPFGRGELRGKAADFEERWDVKRDQLKESLQGVLEHVEGVIDTIEEWDSETAISLEPQQ